jgi:hypothetical protein
MPLGTVANMDGARGKTIQCKKVSLVVLHRLQAQETADGARPTTAAPIRAV